MQTIMKCFLLEGIIYFQDHVYAIFKFIIVFFVFIKIFFFNLKNACWGNCICPFYVYQGLSHVLVLMKIQQKKYSWDQHIKKNIMVEQHFEKWPFLDDFIVMVQDLDIYYTLWASRFCSLHVRRLNTL